MADLDELVAITQEQVGALIAKPKMSSKLLHKPPFRFLHDVIFAIGRDYGFPDLNIFDESEMVGKAIKERGAKVAFLEKTIKAVEEASGQQVAMRPNKVVAGLEPELTNEFLQVSVECGAQLCARRVPDCATICAATCVRGFWRRWWWSRGQRAGRRACGRRWQGRCHGVRFRRANPRRRVTRPCPPAARRRSCAVSKRKRIAAALRRRRSGGGSSRRRRRRTVVARRRMRGVPRRQPRPRKQPRHRSSMMGARTMADLMTTRWRGYVGVWHGNTSESTRRSLADCPGLASQPVVADGQIATTQALLGRIIQKPRLSDKLLSKPPYRFLHDIAMKVEQATGFGAGLFEGDELNGKIKDRDLKVRFLTKFINCIALHLNVTIAARPAKIVAGLEPELTNEMLQYLAFACSRCVFLGAVACSRHAVSHRGWR